MGVVLQVRRGSIDPVQVARRLCPLLGADRVRNALGSPRLHVLEAEGAVGTAAVARALMRSARRGHTPGLPRHDTFSTAMRFLAPHAASSSENAGAFFRQLLEGRHFGTILFLLVSAANVPARCRET